MNKKKIKKIIKNIYPYIIVVASVVLIRTFLITPAIVEGDSMEPNLSDNNIVLLYKLDYRLNEIKRFDVVVIEHNGNKLIKRVVGLPGEHIEYIDNNLYIDGFIVDEGFNHDDTYNFKLETIGYLSIPGDKYFVIGDNRDDSTDSRMIGLIDKENILGSVSFKLFPPGKVK